MPSPRKINQKPPAKKSGSFIHWNFHHSIGSSISRSLSSSLNDPLINLIKSLKVSRSYNGFDRRVTALCWHSNEPNTVAVGSKGGDIIIWNFEDDNQKPKVSLEGSGPGGQIMSVTFDKRDNGRSIFVTSMDGGVGLRDITRNSSEFNKHFVWTESIQDWYTTLDVCFPSRVMAAGHSKGFVELLSIDGESQWKKRLHSNKVTHLEFSSKETWCFVTSSVDRTVKVWDVRKVSDKNSFLFTLQHKRPVNSACFSRMHGGLLLTTDQCDELRTYLCPSFSLSQTVRHPHRQFQHLTPIKASWHPLLDIAVIGRYPEPDSTDDVRSIDFIDGGSGDTLYQLTDPNGTGRKIVSLNSFNDQGDKLLSSIGTGVVVWKPDLEEQPQGPKGHKGPKDEEKGGGSSSPPSKGKKGGASGGGKENKRKEFELNSLGSKKRRR